MEVFTVRSQIRDVAKRWLNHYGAHDAPKSAWGVASPANIYEQLAALDVETATPADVVAIIGDYGWVADPVICDECLLPAPALVGFPIDVGDGTEFHRLCADCLRRASDMLDKLDETA